MVIALPGVGRMPAGAVITRLFARRAGAGDGFDCGVRVVRGRVTGEGRLWRYRSSAVTPGSSPDVTVLHHGRDVVLRLRVDTETTRHRLRPRYVVLGAEDLDSAARVRISCRPEIVHRLRGARPDQM